MPSYDYEERIIGRVAGIDEAGRGPLAGPVVAAAVILNKDNIPLGLDDSKKLTAVKREQIFIEIMASCEVGVGIATVEEIDSINILNATKKAMIRAAQNISPKPVHILVDGNQKPAFGLPATAIVKGDSLSLSIAAASIIAKVTRDGIMAELHESFPHYNWLGNKGYATADHRLAIKEYGHCGHHRKTFLALKDENQFAMELEIA